MCEFLSTLFVSVFVYIGGNSPNTSAEGSRPSGPSVSFIPFTESARRRFIILWIHVHQFHICVTKRFMVTFAKSEARMRFRAGCLQFHVIVSDEGN